MKRVLTILMLVMSGSLLIAVSSSPGDAYAADPTEQYLEIVDVKDDLIADLDSMFDGGGYEGDPDALGGGLENLEQSEGVESDCLSLDGIALDNLWIFVSMTILILP